MRTERHDFPRPTLAALRHPSRFLAKLHRRPRTLAMALGISPEYFLDEMSTDEMSSLLKVDNAKNREEWERIRMGWYYSIIAPGMSKVQSPEDLIKFSWEREDREIKGRKYSKEELRKKEDEALKFIKK